MKITVKSLQGEEYNVDVENDQLVSGLKASISEKANRMAVERIKLVYKGRTLQDSSLLGEYALEEGCKIHLILQKEAPNSSPNVTQQQPQQQISLNDSQSPAYSTHPKSQSKEMTSRCLDSANTTDIKRSNMTTTSPRDTVNATSSSQPKPQSRFEMILRTKLGHHFAPDTVEIIMTNLQHEINADINSSSLDDLERLARQKLNISNE